MKKRFILVVMLIMAVALFMCSCESSKEPNKKPNEGDNTKTDGWETMSTIEPRDVYLKFLSGFTNIAYEFSADRVSEKNSITGDGQLKLSLNDNDFWLTIKGKYDKSSPRTKTIVAAELSSSKTVSEETRLVGAYMYQDHLYLNIGGNKVKFSLANSNWTDYYPYTMKKYTNNDLTNLASVFVSYMKLNKDITGKYRRNSNKEEYMYCLDIDTNNTLVNLSKNLTSLIKNDSAKVNMIKDFVASIMGVTVANLDAGEIPQSSMTVNFMTSGNQIADLDAELNIDLSETSSKLIDGEDLNMKLDLISLNITNDYANGVVVSFVNDTAERNSYENYSEAIYYGFIPMKMCDASTDAVVWSNYTLNITTRIFQSDNTSNFVFLEYYNTTTEKNERALYVYNNIAYLYELVDDEYVCIYRGLVDLSDIASRVVTNNLNGTATFNPYKMIAYIMKNISITTTEIRFGINSEIFTDVWYNYNDMIAYIDECLNGDLTNNAEAMGFLEFMTTNEVIFTLEYDSQFLSVVKFENDGIQKIVNLLTDYEAELSATNAEE